MVSNIIRRKLLVAIESIAITTSGKTITLFLPEGQYHELGLVYVHYLCKSKGINTIYLGADVPMADLEIVVKAKKPDFLFSHIITSSHRFNFEKFLHNLNRKIEETPVIISGPITLTYKKSLSPNFKFVSSLSAVKDLL